MNLFEGGRRLIKIAIAIWVAYVLFHFWERAGDVRQVWVTYTITTFNGPVRLDNECPIDALTTPFAKSTHTDEGTKVLVKLCFLPFEVNGQSLIPYGLDANGRITGGFKYRPEVDKYTQSFAASFSPPESDYTRFDEEASSKVWAYLKKHFLLLMGAIAGGIGFIYGSGFLIGWVLRGFMGIPRGSDE